MNTPPIEIKELADYLGAFADGIRMSGDKRLASKMERSAYWLDQLSSRICCQGFIGCYGGPKCTSDHK